MLRLHIAQDEKVIDRCIDNFEEVFPNENKFLIILKKGRKPRFVTHNVCFAEYGTSLFWQFVGDVKDYKSIIIHFLSPVCVDFLNKINHDNIYWIEWGADLYNLLQNRGYTVFADKNISWRMSHVRLPHFLYDFGKKIYGKRLENKTIKAVKKVKYFVPDSMYDEYEMIKQYYPEFNHLEYKDFFYYPIDEVLGQSLINKHVLGNNIMVGNSASTSGNHLSVFDKLKALPINNCSIITPLSYGNKRYADYVKQKGEEIFGNHFMPIMDFLPLDKYNQLFLTSNIYIYGNWRQEAVGNILIALFLGGKVFLDIKNPLLSFYKKMGLTIFPMEDLSEQSLSSSLSDEEIQTNRNILMEVYSRKRLLSLISSNF